MTTKKTGLGRGLSALLSGDPVVAAPEGGSAPTGEPIVLLPVDRIVPGRHQARMHFDERALAELADSIRTRGVLLPLLVRETPEGYEIIAGERRWRAARLAGLAEVPAVVRREGDGDVHELSLIENLQRADLNPIEEARAYRNLMERFGHTQESLAERLGKERSTIANLLRLLRLPEEIQDDVFSGRLTAGHARALLALPTAEAQREARDRIVAGSLSVRAAERLVGQMLGPRPGRKAPKPPAAPSPGAEPVGTPYPYLVEELQARLSTKVLLKGTEERGMIVIHYYSAEELSRIVDLIGRQGGGPC